jgi:uncharacterized protein (DUF1330 family)
MSAYVVVDLEVLDKEKFEGYKELVPGTIQKYGGRYVVRGGKVETLEGSWHPKRFVVVEFDSVEKAKAWYESTDYATPKEIRQACTRSNIILVEGL